MKTIKEKDIVETVNGVGIIDEIRRTPDGVMYLIRTMGSPALSKGYSDIYSIDEFVCI